LRPLRKRYLAARARGNLEIIDPEEATWIPS
jgi:hypothetical protein